MNEMIKRPVPELPRLIKSAEIPAGHVQGIAVDDEHKYIYYSFTTVFVKADLSGNVVGTVTGLTGHLGCISYNSDDGRVYGSIEYKHDSIGKGIMARTGITLADEDAFYIAIFDVDKIDRVGMDAERDGVMKAVYLPEVVDDYSAKNEDGTDHRFACSGIDGTGFGPVPGSPAGSPRMLFVAYGVYGDNARTDNDNQVILMFDWRSFGDAAKPLSQAAPHHSGVRSAERFFLYTGNTTWGVQNLEYDSYLDAWIVAVYIGKKPQYKNPPMFLIDGAAAPVEHDVPGLGIRGKMLSLKPLGGHDDANGLWYCTFPKGQTGVYSIGGGYYYFSYEKHTDRDGEKYFSSDVKLCRYTGEGDVLFEVVE